MMTEVMLVEGVTDVQLISYYLQNVCGWKHINNNNLGIVPLDNHDHIESLSKGDNQLVLCGVGGNERFTHFVEQHRIKSMIIEREITSLMVVTDRDEASVGKIVHRINRALENVIINAIKEIPEETELIQEVIEFIESLKTKLVPELGQVNKADKATVGTFFSIRNPKNAMRSFYKNLQ